MHDTEVEAAITDLQAKIDRLTEHVNQEIGVAQDVSLCQRLNAVEIKVNANS
jgi:hypothetical protein